MFQGRDFRCDNGGGHTWLSKEALNFYKTKMSSASYQLKRKSKVLVIWWKWRMVFRKIRNKWGFAKNLWPLQKQAVKKDWEISN